MSNTAIPIHYMVQDHVHMLATIPPKYSVAEVVGYLKGKSAIAVARQINGRQRNFMGKTFGRGATLSPPLVLRRRRFVPTSKIRSN